MNATAMLKVARGGPGQAGTITCRFVPVAPEGVAG